MPVLVQSLVSLAFVGLVIARPVSFQVGIDANQDARSFVGCFIP